MEIKDTVLRDIKNLSEYEKEEESYYKPVRVKNFCNNNYIEYRSNSDKIEFYRLKNLLIKLDHI